MQAGSSQKGSPNLTLGEPARVPAFAHSHALVTAVKTVIQRSPAQESVVDQALPSQTAAEAGVAGTVCAEPFRSASLLHSSKEAVVNASAIKQTLQHQVLLQVWLVSCLHPRADKERPKFVAHTILRTVTACKHHAGKRQGNWLA